MNAIEDKIAEHNRRMIIIESFQPGDGGGVGGGSGKAFIGGDGDARLKSTEDKVKQLAKMVNKHASLITLKAENSAVMKIANEKVDKEEFLQMMPNLDTKTLVQNSIKEEIAFLSKTLDEMQRAWDHKIVKLWSDIDLVGLKREISLKTDKSEFWEENEKNEVNVNNVEWALIKLSIDIENANSAFNKMFKEVDSLKEANRNVLMGKKSINCLSCGWGNTNFVPSMPMVKGADGRPYKGRLKQAGNPLGDISM